ncbi:MAG TPA: YoaK family protein [Pseudomonadales bacterium]
MTRLPAWVEYGAFTLALLAGMVNAVGLLGFQHQSVSHLSGTATLLGTAVFGPLPDSLHLLAILLSFLAGSMLSGFFVSGESLRMGRHYDSLLLAESLLLVLAIVFLQHHAAAGHYFASAACGLQNALATRYSGAIVRTTHITGVVTDLGIMLGAMLRGEALDRRKLLLFVLIISGFVAGGSIGALLYPLYQFMTLALPAAICVLLALGYRLYSRKQQQAG